MGEKLQVKNVSFRQITKKILIFAFFGAVIYLIFDKAQEIAWAEVAQALRLYSAQNLIVAFVISLFAYSIYSVFDLLSKIQTGHKVPPKISFLIAFVSYAFNLNLGALVGGFAFRYRLYSQYGMKPGMISRVIGFSILSNWSGYVLLTGITLILEPIRLPSTWQVDTWILQSTGVVMLLVVGVYLIMCSISGVREFQFGKTKFELPGARMALAQLFFSVASWLTITFVLFLLMNQKVPFHTLLGAYLISGLVAVVAHIPAGFGVLEGVMVTLLSGYDSSSHILASVFAFRAVYYLAPLVISLFLYIFIEFNAKEATPSGPMARGQL